MANALDSLLAKVGDEALRAALAAEVTQLRSVKEFGLVFERHLPESVRLLTHPVRKGLSVQERAKSHGPTWVVQSVAGGIATVEDDDGAAHERPVCDLVVVVEFDQPIYPGLVSTGKVERGGEKRPHLVINGENFHALEALLYTHEDKVDVIYLDPPYNSGARDWKYNNDYVDAVDQYRHSKWLAMMERRLRLAGRLLKPSDSALVVTIDENEVHHLGMLLEQVFPEATRQLVTIVNNPKGVTRSTLSRVEEYAFFCFFGSAVASSISGASRSSVVGRVAA